MFVNKNNFPSNRFSWACSGGVDSIASAHLLKTLGFDPILLHFNQEYIPGDTEAEHRFRDFAENFGFEYYICKTIRKYEKGSVEEFARKVRYESLFRVCETVNLGLAHNLNDCMESYLINCLKGQAEYCPIPPITNYEDLGIKLFRPFLLTPKRDFIEYAIKHNLYHFIVEDKLNYDRKLQRAWTRHELIPFINERYAGLETVVLKIMRKFIDRDLILA